MYFQTSGMMIGHAEKRDGLYYLKAPGNLSDSNGKLPLSFFSTHSSTNKDKIRLHHLRFGHPSFGILKVMFPSLFKWLGVKRAENLSISKIRVSISLFDTHTHTHTYRCVNMETISLTISKNRL